MKKLKYNNNKITFNQIKKIKKVKFKIMKMTKNFGQKNTKTN